MSRSTEHNEDMVKTFCVVDSAHGVYVPSVLAEFFTTKAYDFCDVNGGNVFYDDFQNDIEFLADTENMEDDYYYIAWDYVLGSLYVKRDGQTYSLYHNGDVMAICEDDIKNLDDGQVEEFYNSIS